MSEHAILRVLRSAPIDSAAARVSRQTGCADDQELSRADLTALKERLERKLRLLKQLLKITSKAQHTNLVTAIKSGRRGRRGVGMLRLTANPRTALEYKRVGEEIQRMCRRIAEMKQAAKDVA